MRWRKLGVVHCPTGARAWESSHAMLPTPTVHADKLRIYYSTRDASGLGRPAWLDVAADDPTRVVATCERPLIDVGRPGSFDDNGAVVSSVVRVDQKTSFMYYVGFELCEKIRYRLFTGLAVSEDDGISYRRLQETPVLDRSPAEQFFRCGPHVLLENGVFRMWYIGGSEWTSVDGKSLPCYSMKYLESHDGMHWPACGASALELRGEDEHGFGRPWVLRAIQGGYELFYSIRRRSVKGYRLGYAASVDGRTWHRQDDAMGLDVSRSGWDSEAVMYGAVVRIGGRTYIFYNGNDFGRTGFGVAVLEDGR